MTAYDRVVFVYGTLTEPERARAVLARAGATAPAERPSADGRGGADAGARFAFVCEATLEGVHRVEGEYPTLAPDGTVEGRLLGVDRDGLSALDAYEGVDRGLYVRVPVPVEEPSVGSERAWTYVGRPDRLGADASWPGTGPFEERVRRHLDRADAVVRPER